MKASVYTQYGSPDVLQIKEVETPVPGDNDVLIRVHATTVTSEDCIFRKGVPLLARSATGLARPKKPILGTECAGEIEAVGKNVKRFREGDQVFASTGPALGAHAEYICLPEEGALALKPATMGYGEAVAICGGMLTALPFLSDKGHLQRGQRVLIVGASGSVGTAAVQIAKYFGAEVTGVCSTPNVDLVKSLGADNVIDYTKADFTESRQTYDIIFDAVGKSSYSRCKRSLGQRGVYLSTVLSLNIVLQMIRTSTASARKAMITFTGLRPSSEKIKDLTFLKELVEAGKLTSVIDRRYPLDRIVEAHRYVDTGHKRGNVVITLGNRENA